MNNHSGVYCVNCDADVVKEPDHMCGDDPIVTDNEGGLEPVPNRPGKFRCKYCYSFVGRQHYKCVN